jgi:uncharacterized oxidoreductase
MNLSNNTILITGGSGGIGLALAERLYAAGNTILICGRDEARLREAADRLPGLRTFVCDVAQAVDRQRLFEWATTECPQVNVLLNNAGIQRSVRLGEAEDWSRRASEIAINLEAPLHLSSLFIPHLQQQPQAAILNVSSGLAFVPLAGVPIYCATKAAIHSFTLSLRHQLAGTSIEVIELIPPAVHTNLGDTDHSFGVPVGEYADSVIDQLREGRPETTYQFSAKTSQASRAEQDAMFQQLNASRA